MPELLFIRAEENEDGTYDVTIRNLETGEDYLIADCPYWDTDWETDQEELQSFVMEAA